MTDIVEEARAWASALEARANVLGNELKRPGVADRFAEEGRHHELATSAHTIDRLATEITRLRADERAKIKAAWLAGFAASAEGWNGEHLPDAMKRVEDDADEYATAIRQEKPDV